jgi:predicted nuclease with TOPRIM domain
MNDNLNDIHANCEEEAAALRSQLRELQAQLDYEQERNLNSAANAQLQIKELTVERDNWYDACIRAHTRIAELTAELSRLRSGGCAREQNTTQYCGAMQELVSRLTELAKEFESRGNLSANRLREAIAAHSGEGK